MAQGKSYAKEAVRGRLQQPLDQALRELYVDRRHSQQEIANALGVSRMTIATWLREFGITRDDRGPVELTA